MKRFLVLAIVFVSACATNHSQRPEGSWPITAVLYGQDAEHGLQYAGAGAYLYEAYSDLLVEREMLPAHWQKPADAAFINHAQMQTDLDRAGASDWDSAMWPTNFWTHAHQAALVGDGGLPPLDWEAHINEVRVQNWIRYFEGRGREWLETAMQRLAQYFPVIAEIAAQEGVFPGVVALAIVESGMNPAAYSRAGAGGMWQFMRSTGKMYDLHSDFWMDDRFDPLQSTRSSLRHLKDLYNKLGSWPLAFSAYNAGERRVTRAMRYAGTRDYWTLARRHFLPRETRNYVPKIIAVTYMLHQYGWRPADWLKTGDFVLAPVEVPPLSDLNRVAMLLNIPASDLARWNPAFKIGSARPSGTSYLWLPTVHATEFRAHLANGIEPWLTEPKVWTADKRLQSPLQFQKLTGLPAAVLADLNNVHTNHVFRKGELVRLPVGAEVPLLNVFNRVERKVHRVRSGETLSHIARRYGTSVTRLRRQNGIRGSRIYPGQRLVIFEKPAIGKWTTFEGA